MGLCHLIKLQIVTKSCMGCSCQVSPFGLFFDQQIASMHLLQILNKKLQYSTANIDRWQAEPSNECEKGQSGQKD